MANIPPPWTEKEIEILARMKGEGKKYKDIAAVIGRTAEACHSKWKAILKQSKKVNSKATKSKKTENKKTKSSKKFWTDEADLKLLEYADTGMTPDEIVLTKEFSGCTVNAIRMRLYRISGSTHPGHKKKKQKERQEKQSASSNKLLVVGHSPNPVYDRRKVELTLTAETPSGGAVVIVMDKHDIIAMLNMIKGDAPLPRRETIYSDYPE